MDLIVLVLGIAIIGFIVWILTTYVQMPPIFKSIIYVVAAIALMLFLVRQFGARIPNVMP